MRGRSVVTEAKHTLMTSSAAAANDSGQPDSHDFITLGVALAAIVLLVGTGGSLLPQVIQSAQGADMAPNRILVVALLLNIALILFGWHRYRRLTGEVALSRSSEAKALMLSQRDSLTGFLNRRSLDNVLAEMIAAGEAKGHTVAVMVADLDGFKQINDLHGHEFGDQMLLAYTARMTEVLPKQAVIARMGGDEFAFLVQFKSSGEWQIDGLAQALIEKIAEPVEHNGSYVSATLSIGIARSDQTNSHDLDLPIGQRLLNAADIAMYHAKRNGRNRHFWFEASMELELRTRRELEAGIRRGVDQGEFVPYYEQQIDLKTGKLTGFEMLARWNSSTFGVVNPSVFIPIAEELGIIAQLSQQLIAQALRDAMAWDPQLTLSVNISPVQLRDPWFSQKLLKLLIEANFPSNRLEIEITESCLHEDVGAVRTILASLKNQGIRVSLDDFGTGYSSLSQLRELPFDCIKIDRSFVMGLAEGKDSASIIKAITQLGEGLGLPMTAEGIESEELLSELRELGDFKGQGYLYGKPETAAATLERLEKLNLLKPTTTAEPDISNLVTNPKRASSAR
jgi:diguanylate cyclase (GGDEF)-like protein